MGYQKKHKDQDDNPPGCLPGFLLALLRKTSPQEELPYRATDTFLSDAELEFIHALCRVLPEGMSVVPKVRVADIVYVTAKKDYQKYFNKISSKHVDFLVVRLPHWKPLFAIELDDSSHSRASRAIRDEFLDKVFRAARFPLIRIEQKRAYNLVELREQISSAIASAGQTTNEMASIPRSEMETAPLCPKCHVPMVLRTAKYGNQAGKSFYGCVNYPRCKQVIEVPSPEATDKESVGQN